MRALTIKEPWASQIINGQKATEWRSRVLSSGWYLVHSGAPSSKILGAMKLSGMATVQDIQKENDIHLDKWPIPNKIKRIIKFKTPIENVKGKIGIWNFQKQTA